MKAARQFLQSHWPRILLILGVLLFISLVLGYVFGWEWVGVVEYTRFVNGELVEIQRQKTLWDWLDLLIIPAVLAIGAWWLNKTQRDAERSEAKDRWRQEWKIATEKREQETLESYFDRMTELLLSERLWESSLNKEKPEVQTIAKARTLAVLRNLGPERKGHVVQFLYEAGLLDERQPVIALERADLQWAKLVSVGLHRIDLSLANLQNADLFGAWLAGANLRYTNLQEADLTGAHLANADLTGAKLNGAKLRLASLRSAKLNGAELQRVILGHMRHMRMEGAKYDTKTKWPEGFDPKAAGAILVDEEGNPVEEENEQ